MDFFHIDRLNKIQLQELGHSASVVRQLFQELERRWSARCTDRCELFIVAHTSLKAWVEAGMINVNNNGEDFSSRSIGFVDYFALKVTGGESQHFVEACTLHVVQVHGDEHRKQEETTPKARFQARQGVGLGTHYRIEKVAMTVFILAPVFKEVENRVELILRMLL